MKKYQGYMICTDMDGTLLDQNHLISEENERAIKYFMNEGGIFTVATGRSPVSVIPFFSELKPNAPIVTHNGAAIYNLDDNKYMQTFPLLSEAIEVLEYVEDKFAFTGIEIYDYSDIYFSNINESIKWHMEVEGLQLIEKDYHDIPSPWTKAMFVQSREETTLLREHLMKTDYWKKYSFIKSSSIFLELLSPNAEKGNAMLHIKKLLGKDIHTVICVGDNENDISLLKAADVSYAVENAIDDLKKVAKNITVSNNENAIEKIIGEIN